MQISEKPIQTCVFPNSLFCSKQIFYQGEGKVCAVTDIKNQSLPVHHPEQTYACEDTSYLNDPYEGELFTWWLQFFGGLSDADIEALWDYKRPQLVSVDYHIGKVGPITVQKGDTYPSPYCESVALRVTLYNLGYWFSSHETWKVLEMPYYDIDIVR